MLDKARNRLAALDARHGPLPVLLLGLTVLTGMVDAVSYLGLGHVFVANMTGNVVFMGFAAAGIAEFSVPASLTAVAAILVGAYCGGRLAIRYGAHRGRLFWIAMAIEIILIAAAFALALATSSLPNGVPRYGLVVLLGLVMGLQNAVVRRLAVPDLTTTVLTLTITGLAADNPFAKGNRLRRLLSVGAMFLGAAIGGLLIVHVGVTAVLGLALALTLAIGLVAALGRSANLAWTSPK